MMKKIIDYFYDNPEEDNLISLYMGAAGIITIVVCSIIRLFFI